MKEETQHSQKITGNHGGGVFASGRKKLGRQKWHRNIPRARGKPRGGLENGPITVSRLPLNCTALCCLQVKCASEMLHRNHLVMPRPKTLSSMPISPADAGIIWRHFCDGNKPPTSPRDMARAIERWFCLFPNSSDLWGHIKPLAVTLRKAALATHQTFGLRDEHTADEIYARVLDDIYEIFRNSKNRSEFKLRFLLRCRDAAVAASPPGLLHEKTTKTVDVKRWGDLPGKLAGLSREVFAEEEGAMRCLKAAEGGNAVAQGELGVRYYCGIGIKPNRSAAIYWLQRGVSQGGAGAQAFLARCYAIGTGVEKNHSEAFKLAKESAEQGHPMGQLLLGHCFHFGWGVEKDHRQALSWYFLAADQELPPAEALVGKAFEDGDVFAQDYVEAAKWYRRAEEHGDSSAELGYGW